MPTECERSDTSPEQQQLQIQQIQEQQRQQQQQQQDISDSMEALDKETNGEMSTSQTSTTSSNSHNGSTNGSGRKTSLTSADPTAYVAKARVTRPTPPPPSYNPMQFVQIKPCNLYQTAQQQLKKAEEVKKIKEIKKEEPEDWQNNLDNWKSSRRKRVEHIIDRVVEVKKLELEEHDRSRRKSKTFSEMIEERGDRGVRSGRTKLASLAVYNEDESNDLSDLGIGTSSASGKSSLSEDYDNNSVMSDNAELDKAIFENNHKPNSITREYISSPGYDTSSSTAPASSPDPCEYTYEGAIQDYKQRVSRATSGSGGTVNYKLNNNNNNGKASTSKESTPERMNNGVNVSTDTYPTRRGSKIEDRLIGFEVTSPSDSQEGVEKIKMDVPKIDISKRKEIFESQTVNEPKSVGNLGGVPKVTLRDRFKPDSSSSNETKDAAAAKKEVKRFSGDITSIRDRLQSLEQQQNLVNSTNGATKSAAVPKLVDIPVPRLKERLSSLHNAVTKEEVKKPPVVLIDARQLEIMKNEEETAQMRIKQLEVSAAAAAATEAAAKSTIEQAIVPVRTEIKIVVKPDDETEVDRDDSGIHTSDDIDVEERIAAQLQQEEQLNAAIAALAMEEKQLEEAANAVNQIEAEFAELSSAAAVMPAKTSATNEQPCDMEISVSSTNNLPNYKSSNNSSSYGCSFGKQEAKCIRNDNVEVLGPPSSACNLRRKPSNEMVHARNLLKMFKETFNNEIELDEEAEDVAVGNSQNENIATLATENCKVANAASDLKLPLSTAPIAVPSTPNTYICTTSLRSSTSPLNSPPIRTLVFHSSTSPSNTGQSSPISTPQTPPAKSPGTPSMIPRSIHPVGKPPMSPKAVRCNAKLLPQSPANSPTPTRKADSQFSINGRVEIFNSKNMSNVPKPPTPTASTTPTPTKKSYLPQLSTATTTTNENSDIGLPLQQALAVVTTSPAVTEARSIANQTNASFDGKSMPATTVIEPRETRSINVVAAAAATEQPEVVVCAPPLTIVNPDELPKPNTVKALTSCFSQDVCKPTPPKAPPKPLPRSRIPQTPPQSPTPAKRNFVSPPAVTKDALPQECTNDSQLNFGLNADDSKKLSIISNTSTISCDSMGHRGPFETTAIVHSPPNNVSEKHAPTPAQHLRVATNASKTVEDPLKPNDSLTPIITAPSAVPPLVVCTPNESSLFKLASSAPHSPSTPGSSADKPSDDDIALCASFLSSITPTTAAKSSQLHAPPVRQQTVDEVLCDKVDVRTLPPHDQVPSTTFYEITPAEVKRCDGFGSLNATPAPAQDTATKPQTSKPNSPIMAARAAHSKALIETCEKIIAEERLASNQMKSSLPSSPKATPVLQRKSRIPKPICCIGAADSMSAADHDTQPSNADEGLLIARLHVVETQIKVTTTTPPASPKVQHKAPPPTSGKKTKNIFEFLKKNFSTHEETPPTPPSYTPTEEAVRPKVDTVKFDEIITIDNSKFYIPSDDVPAPPLPATPAPVNIEITKKITTDEILEESNSEKALSQEINDMLDDELNKLSLETPAAQVVVQQANRK